MCPTCRAYTFDPANKLTPQGFGQCAHMDAWHYRSQRAWGCYFTPSRFAEAR